MPISIQMHNKDRFYREGAKSAKNGEQPTTYHPIEDRRTGPAQFLPPASISAAGVPVPENCFSLRPSRLRGERV
jgi:hypothetical protein